MLRNYYAIVWMYYYHYYLKKRLFCTFTFADVKKIQVMVVCIIPLNGNSNLKKRHIMYLNSSNMVYLILKIFKICALNGPYSELKARRPHAVSYGSLHLYKMFSVLN